MDTRMRRKLYALMLVGGLLAAVPVTQAVFTDSQAVDANTFTTGTVNISTTPTTALITFSNMAPGDAITDDIAVSNAGSLALRYAISSTATNADSKSLKDQLALTIKTQDVDLVPDANPCDDWDGTQLYTGDMDSTAGKLVGDSAQGSQSGDRTLAASASESLCFRASLPSATGDAFQGATTTVTFTFAAEQTANN